MTTPPPQNDETGRTTRRLNGLGMIGLFAFAAGLALGAGWLAWHLRAADRRLESSDVGADSLTWLRDRGV